MLSLLSFFHHRWIAPRSSSHSAIITCYYNSPDSSVWLETLETFPVCISFWPCIATFRAWLCNHHHTPVKINGRSMFYSWLLEMARFLRVELGERRGHEREEGGEVGRGKERRDCPMLVGMVTWPGEREPGRREGEGGLCLTGVAYQQPAYPPQSPAGLSVSSLPSGLLWRNRTLLTSIWKTHCTVHSLPVTLFSKHCNADVFFLFCLFM